MSLATGITALASRLATEFNSVRTAISGKADTVHTHAGADISSGTVAYARLPVGTAAGTVAIGNHNHSGVYQPADADLDAIAGLGVTNDSIIQGKLGVWAKRTIAQFKVDLNYTAADIGLGNVNNTSDANKPVSSAQAAADLLRAGGVVGRNRRSVSESGAADANLFPVISVIATVVSGRSYRVWFQSELRCSVSASVSQTELRYTTNNTEPTTSSALLTRGLVGHQNVDVPDTLHLAALFNSVANGTLRVGVFGKRAVGSGLLTYDSSVSPTEIVIEDVGPTVSETGTDA